MGDASAREAPLEVGTSRRLCGMGIEGEPGPLHLSAPGTAMLQGAGGISHSVCWHVAHGLIPLSYIILRARG